MFRIESRSPDVNRYHAGVSREHHYSLRLTWTGNHGAGTSGYRDYGRTYRIEADGKPVIEGSSDKVFRGNETRWNPEEFLVAALTACHKLAYLHLCATAGVVVIDYHDEATGLMRSEADGGGRFVEVCLHPTVVITSGSDRSMALQLHEEAHAKCFIANSVNFPVRTEASIQIDTGDYDI